MDGTHGCVFRMDALWKRPNHSLIVPPRDFGKLIHMFFPGLRDVVHIAEKFLVATWCRYQDVPRVVFADIGEAVDDTPWDCHSCACARDFGFFADEVLQLSLNYNKEFVLSERNVGRRATAGHDRHVKNAKHAGIRVNDFCGYSSKFRRLEFQCDPGFHFYSIG